MTLLKLGANSTNIVYFKKITTHLALNKQIGTIESTATVHRFNLLAVQYSIKKRNAVSVVLIHVHIKQSKIDTDLSRTKM